MFNQQDSPKQKTKAYNEHNKPQILHLAWLIVTRIIYARFDLIISHN